MEIDFTDERQIHASFISFIVTKQRVEQRSNDSGITLDPEIRKGPLGEWLVYRDFAVAGNLQSSAHKKLVFR